MGRNPVNDIRVLDGIRGKESQDESHETLQYRVTVLKVVDINASDLNES